MALTPLDFAVILAYLGGLSLIGVWFSRRQATRDDYHLGGRKIHWILAGGSVLATLFSTLTMLGAPGEMVRYGVAYYTGMAGFLLAAPAINHFVIPTIRSLQAPSIYSYLGTRFAPGVRRLASTFYVLRTLLWMALIIYSCSFAVAEVTGWNLYATLVVTGLLTTFYASIGGLKSVVWTDNLQLLILMGGVLAIPLSVSWRLGTGPIEWWGQFSQAGRTEITPFSLDPTVRITLTGILLTQFFWALCANGSDQSAAQRYIATPGIAEARRSVWFYSALNVCLMVLLMLCGLALFAFYLRQSGLGVSEFQTQIAPLADRLMPMYIARELPAGISGLLLAALLAAAMSSLSSGVNSISSVIMTDFVRDKASATSLKLDKSVAAVAGVLGISLALVLAYSVRRTDWNLYEMTSRLNNMLVGPMAVLFFTGLLLKRAGTGNVIAGFACAVAIAATISFSRISFTWLVPVSFLSGLLVAGVGSLLLTGNRNVDVPAVEELR